MAGGVSKYFQREWEYDYNGDRFQDRVGRILSCGHNLKENFQTRALETAKKSRAFENKTASNKPDDVNPDFLNQAEPGHTGPGVDKRGMIWVTKAGGVIGPATEEKFRDDAPPPTPRAALTTERQKFMATLDPSARSMVLWKAINPACMDTHTKLPGTSHSSHYRHLPDEAEPVNKEFHFQKSDFTAYANAQIKYGAATIKR